MNNRFSTIRLISKIKSKVVYNPADKFKSELLLSKFRGCEGGLRTKGYFKHSYKMVDGEWFINNRNNEIFKIQDEQLYRNLNNHQSFTEGKHTRTIHKLPLVTIITVVFNGEKYLEETIQSVLGQSYDNVEYIVIDGDSNDGTIDIIKKYDDKLDYWVSEKDNGIYHAMNKGITLAGGRIIGIINSDDWLESETIRKVVDASISLGEEEYVIHGKIAFYNRDNKFVTEHSPKKIPGYYLFSAPFKHPAMFVSRNVYEQKGLYDDSCGFAADYDFMLRIISEGIFSFYIDQVFTNVRLVGITTGGDVQASNKELILILKRNTGSLLLAIIGLVVRIIRKGFQFIINKRIKMN